MAAGWLLLPAVTLASSGFESASSEHAVTLASPAGHSYVSAELVGGIHILSTTKDYAQYLMNSYQGWELRPELSLGGFSFNFIDRAPCAGVVTHHDGASYLFYRACGAMAAADLERQLREARRQLLEAAVP